jgi:NAD(P)-dependent dehydrogenase (short-subunit alcohol dehydrogenase family)
MEWTLVTGGAKRLGAEICQGLAKQGLPILIHYKTGETEAKKVAQVCRALGVDAEIVQGDLSSMLSTQQFIEHCLVRYPAIKNLINNVGNYLVKSAGETSFQEWEALFQTNLHAPFALSRAFLPSLLQHRGNIINIGTAGMGCIRAEVCRTAYSMTKMCLLMLTKSLARELASSHVRVNMVSPGYLENAVDLPEKMPELSMQRPAKLQEVVRVIGFLLDEKSGYITGQNIEVSGGIAL